MKPFIHMMHEPVTTPEGDGLNVRFESNWWVQYGNYKFMVPEGFVSDFNSVPRGLWNLLPPFRYPRAGYLHDFLYNSHFFSRSLCDAVYRDTIQLLDHCPCYAAWIRWAALRCFGWIAWRSKDPQQVIWWRVRSGYRLEDFPLDKKK